MTFPSFLIIDKPILLMKPKPREINLSLFVQFVLLVAVGTFVAIGTTLDTLNFKYFLKAFRKLVVHKIEKDRTKTNS